MGGQKGGGLPQQLEHCVLQASSLQYEMLLLTDSISKEDSCWELRLRCGEFRAFIHSKHSSIPPSKPLSCALQSCAGESCLQPSQHDEHPCLSFSSQPLPDGSEHQDSGGC